MRLKVNLFSRGLILVSLPILGQLIFIVVIAVVMQQAQNNLERQWRQENLLRVTFSICREVTDLLLWLQLPPSFRNMIGLDVSSSWLVQAKKDSDQLKQLGADDPAKSDALNRLVEAKTYLFDVLERMLSTTSSQPLAPWGAGVGASYRSGLGSYGRVFYDSVQEIVDIEKKREETANLYASAFSNFQSSLVLMSAVSFVLALLAGYLYVISIRRPLKHLSENGSLLAQQSRLLPVLRNADQFTKIDELLHTASLEIENLRLKEREVIENAQDMICTLDRSGVFLTANPFVSRMLGYEPEYVITTPVSNYAVAEQKTMSDQCIGSAVTSQSVQQFELQLLHMNGNIVETRWSCLWSSAERKLFCVVHDITEDKRIEQLKQDFTDMISHDLRSPLMAMGNALTLIKSGAKGEVPEKALARIERSSRNVEKLIVLVNDLLDFQKLKAGKMELTLEPFALESIIKDAADLVEEVARDKGVKLELPAGETVLQCDRNKLMQTAVNLIANAVKFSGPGSAVSIRVDRGVNTVSFSISDTGPGIVPEFEERIFEPFEQAPSDKKKEGTGLGLAICKLVAEAHGGSIRVRNRAGEDFQRTGSVFTVELPA
jgi:PAS domain S-box-containing protein